jgi:rhodanese-related sulfurtransferase
MKHSPGFLRIVEDAKTRIRELTVDDVKAMLGRGERFHLVDVREESEWDKGHLPTAKHLCKGIIERDVEEAIPLRARRRQSAEDGLRRRLLDGRRLAGVERARLRDREGLTLRRAA